MPRPAKSRAAQSDTIQVECECGKRIKAPASAAGKSAKCPACGEKIRIPADEPEPEAPRERRSGGARGRRQTESRPRSGEREAPGRKPRRRGRSSRGKGGPPWALIGAGGGALVLLLIGLMLRGGETPSAVVDRFLTAGMNADWETAKACLIESERSDTRWTDPKQNDKAKSVSWSFGSVSIEGDKALVNTTLKRGDKSDKFPFILQREGGAWKISMAQSVVAALKGQTQLEKATVAAGGGIAGRALVEPLAGEALAGEAFPKELRGLKRRGRDLSGPMKMTVDGKAFTSAAVAANYASDDGAQTIDIGIDDLGTLSGNMLQMQYGWHDTAKEKVGGHPAKVQNDILYVMINQRWVISVGGSALDAEGRKQVFAGLNLAHLR